MKDNDFSGIDRSRVEKDVTATSGTGVEIGGGAHSNSILTINQHFESIVKAIDDAPIPHMEKVEARSKLTDLLNTKAAEAICGGVPTALIKGLGP